MRKLHVAVRSIAPSGGFGGLERAAADHVARMREIGLDVVVYAPGIDTAEGVVVPWPAVSRPQSMLHGAAYARWTQSLARVLHDAVAPGDVVHFHGSSAAAATMLPKRVPAVMNPHGLEEFDPIGPTTLAVRPILRHLSLRGATACARVISTDRSISASLVRKLRIDEKKVAMIPNAVDATALRSLAASSRGSMEDAIATNVVSVGRIEHNKGYDLLAAALVQNRDLPWRWTHFGSGSQREAVWSIIGNASLVDRVSFVSGASDAEVQGALSRADLFVQPSRSEGSSLTTLEAMAHARFILATAVGGIPDKISSGVDGLLSSPDVDALTSDLRLALKAARTQTAFRMGALAAQRVEREFSAKAATEACVSLYQTLHSGA